MSVNGMAAYNEAMKMKDRCPDCGSPDYMKVPVFAGGGGQMVDEVLECQQCYDREVYGEVRA